MKTSPELESLILIGGQMSNLCFNLGQNEKQQSHATMRDLQCQWDKRLAELRAALASRTAESPECETCNGRGWLGGRGAPSRTCHTCDGDGQGAPAETPRETWVWHCLTHMTLGGGHGTREQARAAFDAHYDGIGRKTCSQFKIYRAEDAAHPAVTPPDDEAWNRAMRSGAVSAELRERDRQADANELAASAAEPERCDEEAMGTVTADFRHHPCGKPLPCSDHPAPTVTHTTTQSLDTLLDGVTRDNVHAEVAYYHAGRTIECGHCHPEKYAPENAACCICHDARTSPAEPSSELLARVIAMRGFGELEHCLLRDGDAFRHQWELTFYFGEDDYQTFCAATWQEVAQEAASHFTPAATEPEVSNDQKGEK